MNSSPSVVENDTDSATAETSTFTLEIRGCVRSPAMKWAHHYMHQTEVALRSTLFDMELRPQDVKKRHERTSGKFLLLRRYINLTTTCQVECAAEVAEEARRNLKLALLHLPPARAKLRDITVEVAVATQS